MNLVISLNKPKDITSQDAVTKVKKILKVKKAGHCGTLDPMATGLLLICINKATRLATYLSGSDKEYIAVMKLGESTDTQDAYGEILEKADSIDVSEADIKAVLSLFKGKISQLPPMFSALKHKGKPLYEYARQGIDIARTSREVNIKSIELLDFDLPFVKLKVACSKGTYIRTLCHDIGKKLGVGAHMTELQRTAIGEFNLQDALEIDELKELDITKTDNKAIHTLNSALKHMPEFKITENMVLSVSHGNAINIRQGLELSDDIKTAQGIRILSPDNELLAVGRYGNERKIIKMDVVFAL
ncbi:MAG: tRNA pseudouridine(55) synthase TruB [Thermodesulfovibrionia bacterium]|nr:tRNA pseudouridine(55) synthase TruB [Thermodesulfovibrionia bacterium]